MAKTLAEVQAIINAGGSFICSRTRQLWNSLDDIPADYYPGYCSVEPTGVTEEDLDEKADDSSQVDTKTWTWDGGASAPIVAVGDMVFCPIAGTITNVRVVAYDSTGTPTSGSAGITITKGTDPTSLTAGTTASLTSATSSSASKSVAVAAGSYIKAVLDSVAGAGVVKIKLFIDFARTA